AGPVGRPGAAVVRGEGDEDAVAPQHAQAERRLALPDERDAPEQRERDEKCRPPPECRHTRVSILANPYLSSTSRTLRSRSSREKGLARKSKARSASRLAG